MFTDELSTQEVSNKMAEFLEMDEGENSAEQRQIKKIGQYLGQIRKDKKIDLRTVSEWVGVQPKDILFMEMGFCHYNTFNSRLKDWMEVLDVSEDDISNLISSVGPIH